MIPILKITLNKSGAFDNLKRFFSFFLRRNAKKYEWAFFFVSKKVDVENKDLELQSQNLK